MLLHLISDITGHSKDNPMKVAVDVHGVMDASPEEFQPLLEQAISTGLYKIYVISGPPKLQVKKELDALGYEEGKHYHFLFTIVDHLLEYNVKMWKGDKGTWWASDVDWWSAKAAICKEHDIDFLIDNTELYNNYFKDIKTKFWLYKR